MENTKIIQKKAGIRKQEAKRAEMAARIKTDGKVFGKTRSDLEDLAFLKRPQGKPSGRSKCLSRRESEGDVR